MPVTTKNVNPVNPKRINVDCSDNKTAQKKYIFIFQRSFRMIHMENFSKLIAASPPVLDLKMGILVQVKLFSIYCVIDWFWKCYHLFLFSSNRELQLFHVFYIHVNNLIVIQ